MTKEPADLATGRGSYEWEQFTADVLTRLAVVETGGGGGSGEALVATAPADDTTTALLDVRAHDATSVLYYQLATGASADGGDFYILTATYGVDMWAYSNQSSATVYAVDGPSASIVADGDHGQLNAYSTNGGTVEATASPTAVTLLLRTVPDQTDPPVRVLNSDGDLVASVSIDGDIEAAHGVILTSPNATRYRLLVGNDGTLSTEPA